MKYNWQCASAKLAIWTAHVEGYRVGPRALLHALRHYTLRAKTTLTDFFCGFNPDYQTAKFNSPSILWLYSTQPLVLVTLVWQIHIPKPGSLVLVLDLY